MPNLRIISDNAADRAALTASTTAGALGVSNLKTDVKSDVWRATAAFAVLTALWATPEPVQAVAWPMCNWSPTAAMRVRVSTEAAATNLALYSEQFDNGVWAKSNGTIAANAAVAPNGQATADRFTATGADGYIIQNVSGATNGQPHVFSIWLKSNAARTVRMYIGETLFTAAVTTAWQRFSGANPSVTSTTVPIQMGGGFTLPSGSTLDMWGAQAQVGAVADSYYPTTSAPATRPAGFIDGWQSYNYDSGYQYACPAPALRLRGWTAAQAASAYAYGGGACARMWLPAELLATGMSIWINDPDNLQGYVEAARLVIGPYWSPTYNASDASMTTVDSTALYRTDAGNQAADAGTICRQVSIDMSMMPPSDRTYLAKLLRNSRAYPIFLSLFPESDDLALERDHAIYGRRTQDSEMSIQNSIFYGTKIPVEEI